MKKLIAIIAITGIFLTTSVHAQSPVSFVMNVSPASFLVSFNINGFKVQQGIPNSLSFRSDEISGATSVTPYMNLGLSVNTTIVFIDITGGGGFLYNKAFYGPTYRGDIALRFRPSTVFTIGMHAGPVFGNFTWNPSEGYSDDNDVKFDNFAGFVFGPTLSVGKTANFFFTVDYLLGSMDVNTYNGWTASDNNLDLSGLMMNFGFLLRIPYRDKY